VAILAKRVFGKVTVHTQQGVVDTVDDERARNESLSMPPNGC
jgi:hypothetical protein